MKKKLIEVALPLEAINAESAREKSIRHGHPSTLHLWWARRPLAACRAVLFASLVDDPSSWTDKFPTEEEQDRERQRLFDILGKITTETDKKGNSKQVVRGLVSWDDINNPQSGVLEAAQKEIARSIAWNRGEEAPTKPDAVREYLIKYAPPVYDPFCGGGSIPLEAQRLGLEAHGSDLNPVAVLITKALIEIPPKFRNLPPINPEARKKLQISNWAGAQGLAEDVRYYGKWMRDEAFKRIGHLYPKVNLPDGREATVIAWLWARTVKCPNPACGCQMPLVRSFQLSTKKGKEAWVEPVIERQQTPPVIQFAVKTGKGNSPEGTVNRRGAICIACGTPVPFDHIRSEGKAGRMKAQLMAIVAEGDRGRIYQSPSREHERIAKSEQPRWKPEAELPNNSRDIRPQLYGMPTYGDLFTSRQLIALTTFSDLVTEAREKIKADSLAASIVIDEVSLNDGGIGAVAYADAIATYLAFAVDKAVDAGSALVSWRNTVEATRNTFARQALPMVWDFTEANFFSESCGNWIDTGIEWIVEAVFRLPKFQLGLVHQIDATITNSDKPKVISTDPPYYDNIGYADLSDFFYIWLRRSINFIYPDIFSTLLVPKTNELVAAPYRFGDDKQKAKSFFEEGLGKAFERMNDITHADYPLTVYYAFKQTETEIGNDNEENIVASTGWETMLAGLIKADFSIDGTWPVRTERSARSVSIGTNALASSIVLVCRRRPNEAPKATRRQFVNELKRELPQALHKLQQANIAPVDLAQASIGPGMAVFSKYAAVLESDGSPMRVRTALQLINQVLDEFLTEQEGEFDADTRWALTWFEQHQFNAGLYGDAETLSKAKNTSVQGMVEAGILEAKSGKVRLLKREELKADWKVENDDRTPVWEVAQYLIHTLDTQGEIATAKLLKQLGSKGELARDLSYRLYSLCDRKGWTQEAIAYNSLVISWSEISRLASEIQPTASVQGELF